MRRLKRHEEPQNHERWLVSYADFITLLFAFFVVMYSTSSVNEGKMRVLSDSLLAHFPGRNKALAPIQVGELTRSPYVDDISSVTSASRFVIVAPPDPISVGADGEAESALEKNDGLLGGLPAADGESAAGDPEPGSRGRAAAGSGPASPAASDGSTRGVTPVGDVDEVAESVEQGMSDVVDLSRIGIRKRASWLEVELDSSELFESGNARIARKAIPVLSRLAEVLNRFGNPIQVEGFTDDLPISTLTFPSNWELSAARAASVVHLFTKQGIAPDRMVAIGYGEHRPAVSNATPAGRARNRRVVVVVPANTTVRRLIDQPGTARGVAVTEGQSS